MGEMLIKYFTLTDQAGNIYFNTMLYFLSNISIFEVKCISNTAELFVIGKDKLKVLLKEASTIRSNLESYVSTKKKMIYNKLLMVRENMINFIENFKMENSFFMGISLTDSSTVDRKSPLSIKKRRLVVKDSPTLMPSFPNFNKRAVDNSYNSQFNTINTTNLPISLVCFNSPVSPVVSNQKKNNNFTNYINNTPFNTIGAYSTFQSIDTKLTKKTTTTAVNSLKILSVGEIKRKLNLLNKKEIRWNILSKNSDSTYSQIASISKPKNIDKLKIKEDFLTQEHSIEIKKQQLKCKPFQGQKILSFYKDKRDNKSKLLRSNI